MDKSFHSWIAVLVLTLLYGLPAGAQTSADGWTAHTSMRSAVDVSSGVMGTWTATTGGVFGYDPDTGEIDRYSIVNGLSGIEATTIAVDEERQVVWVGYADGVLDRIDPENADVRSFRDIARAGQYPDRGLNVIRVFGDSLLIGTEFGIVVFDPVKEEVRDSYTRLGDVAAGTPVSDVRVGPEPSGGARLWAATIDGVAHIPMDASNLQDPNLWEVDRMGLSGDALDVRALGFVENTLYAGTASDVFRRSQDGSFSRLSISSGAIGGMTRTDDGIVGAGPFNLFTIDVSGSISVRDIADHNSPSAVAQRADGSVWVADRSGGLVLVPDPFSGSGTLNPLHSVVPDGPYFGRFRSARVGPDGSLWLGGESGPNQGFFRLADGEWTDYIGSEYPAIVGKDRFFSVAPLSDGGAWAASEGGGVVSVDAEGQVTAYDASNSSLNPAVGTSDFIIAAGVAPDSDGNIWVTTRASSTPLHVRTADGNWTAFGPRVGDDLTTSSTAYGRIFVDSFDQKYIIIRSETNFELRRGLMVLDTGNVTDPNDDEFRFFDAKGGSGQGLPSTSVFAVAEDRDGLVWIGTSSGPAYFINSGIIARDAGATPIWPQWADRSDGTFVLFGLSINDIAIDPANRIWFATDDGAWLIQAVEGGYELVQHFTAENSPLFSDAVNAIAVDPESGRVYMSTSLGLISYTSDAIAPSASAKDLFVFPNPVRIAGNSAPDIYIDGLVESAELRIVTAAGSLVRRLHSRGGRIKWDGRDESGRLVSSGVYLVVAVGDNNEGAATGKIAVIH